MRAKSQKEISDFHRDHKGEILENLGVQEIGVF